MEIKKRGIYFKQTDQKETGYYTKDANGSIIHHEYKKPTFWERTKYFAKYGYEMNMETIVTSYLYFSANENEVTTGSMVGDAISISKYLRDKRNFGSWYKYTQQSNLLRFETNSVIYNLEFLSDGIQVNVRTVYKNNSKTHMEIYLYLDWENI